MSKNFSFTEKIVINNNLRSFIFLIIGSFLSAFAINIFFTPLMLTMGGISGIASIVYQLTGQNLPLGIIIAILNIPLLILGWIKVNRQFVYKSIIGSALYSFSLAITEKPMNNWFQNYFNKPTVNGQPDLLIFCVFGGILFGIAMGLILRGGYTTGGTDIIAIIMHKHFPSLTIGKIILVADVFIVASSLLFYIRVQPNVILITMYSFIAMFLTSKFTDIALEGLQAAKLAYIISDKQEEIAEQIFDKLDRGATLIKATGMYSNTDRDMVFCVLPNRQVPRLKEIVNIIDPNAFIIVAEVREVLGEGFEKDTSHFL